MALLLWLIPVLNESLMRRCPIPAFSAAPDIRLFGSALQVAGILLFRRCFILQVFYRAYSIHIDITPTCTRWSGFSQRKLPVVFGRDVLQILLQFSDRLSAGIWQRSTEYTESIQSIQSTGVE